MVVVRRVLNRRTSGSLREYVHHPNPHPVFKQTKRYSHSETPQAETYRNSGEKFCHGILCDLFIGLGWNHILHLIVLPGRMRYKRISRLKKYTPDSILSLLPETRGYLAYSSVPLFQRRRHKTPHSPWGRAPTIHNALPIARKADRSDAAITQPLPNNLLSPEVLKRTSTTYTQNHRLTTKQRNS